MWRLFGRDREKEDGAGAPGCEPPSSGYAVLDFETTGFSWESGDRVVEVGLVLLDAAAEPTGAWTTLVDPGRQIAGTEIHQITDRDVAHAPRFEEIAGLVVSSCAGRVLVAHNLKFDAGFLKNELALAGVPVVIAPDAGLCTQLLARHYLPHASSSLEELCFAAGITVRYRHWAMWDAQATGRLLRYYLADDPAFARHWCREIESSLAVEWPELPQSTAQLLPRCLPAAGHPDDDWCVPEVRPVESPPLPSRRIRR